MVGLERRQPRIYEGSQLDPGISTTPFRVKHCRDEEEGGGVYLCCYKDGDL